MKSSLLVLAVVLLASLMGPFSTMAADIVPYGSGGWRYMQVTAGDAVESEFYLLSFDDSDWKEGQAAFGSFGCPGCSGCEVDQLVTTYWAANTDLLLRRTFSAYPPDTITIRFAIDNDAWIYVNGTLIYNAIHDGCALLDDYGVLVPSYALSETGSNLLAVLAHDYGYETFVDVRVEGQPFVGVEQEKVPSVFTMSQSYPNPFNPLCTIRYDIPRAGRVSLRVFDVNGSLVRTLVDGWREIGVYSEVWNGKADDGTALSSGVYFYQLKAGDFVATRKIVLLR